MNPPPPPKVLLFVREWALITPVYHNNMSLVLSSPVLSTADSSLWLAGGLDREWGIRLRENLVTTKNWAWWAPDRTVRLRENVVTTENWAWWVPDRTVRLRLKSVAHAVQGEFRHVTYRWGCASVSDRHAGSIPRCSKEFFFQRQLSLQTLSRYPYIPVCDRMHLHLCAR